MKALTFHGKQTIHFETVPDPSISDPGDVIVKVDLCAICGSDLHPYHEREKGLDHGTIMGHEFVGEIVEIGPRVKKFKTGTKVFSPFTTNCGQCFYCKKGLTCRCVHGQLYGWREKGQGLHGTQAEFVRVPLAEGTLMQLPDEISEEEGLLLGDIFSTGYFCADMAEIEPNGTYVVIGCGPVGLMAIAGALELGAEKLFAIDCVPLRLQHAEKFGAISIDFSKQSPIEVLAEATEGRGADAVLEVVGSHSAGRSAYELVRPGGIIATVGVHTESHLPFSPVEAYDKNITYKSGRCPVRYYMQRLVPMVQKKRYDLTSIVTHRSTLADGVKGYRIFDEKQDGCLKVVMKP